MYRSVLALLFASVLLGGCAVGQRYILRAKKALLTFYKRRSAEPFVILRYVP